MNLSGLVCTRNCIQNDYCFVECITSMLAVCDEVVVHDKQSTDNTLEALKEWASRDSRIRVIEAKWEEPRDDRSWYVRWINEGRVHARFPMLLHLDADEVLGDNDATYSAIKFCVDNKHAIAMNRLNFARDPFSLIPEGECCGRYVVRCGPSHLKWVSDEPHRPGEIPLLDMATISPYALIFHLGFLRHPEAFFKKARVVLGAFFGNYDSRLVEAEANGKPPLSSFSWWNRLEPYKGTHPEAVKAWLRARGYRL